MSDEKKEQPDEAAATEQKPKKGLPLKGILTTAVSALALAGVGAGAAFLGAPTGQKCAAAPAAPASGGHAKTDPKDVAYVNLEPLVISLGPGARSKYLKISISLETSKTYEKSLNELSPRIRDVLNSYLRAVEESDLQRPASMTRLRAQMLRRLQLVSPQGAVNDILITDFVLT
ncbi:MAG: flagellar basal body-associated FliL family protein [Amphiplicatus sp.]